MFVRPIFFDAANDGGGAEPQSLAEAIAANAENPPTFVPIPDGALRPDGDPVVPVVADAAPAAVEGVAAPVDAPVVASVTPAAPADPFAAYGGEQAVKDALGIQQLLTTEQGVRMMVAEGLTRLDKSPEDVRAFMEGKLTLAQLEAAPAATANPWDSLTEDDVVDGKQAKEWFTQVRDEAIAAARAEAQALQTAALTPLEAQLDAGRRERAGQASDATIIELLGEGGDVSTVDADLAGEVLRAANKYIQDGNWEPGHIRAAIIQGHHDVVTTAEVARNAYLTRKAHEAATTPTNTGSAQAVGSEDTPEPQSTAEASKLAKALFKW